MINPFKYFEQYFGNSQEQANADAVMRLADAPDLLNRMVGNAYGQAQNELSSNEVGSRFVEFLSEISGV